MFQKNGGKSHLHNTPPSPANSYEKEIYIEGIMINTKRVIKIITSTT